MLDSGCLMLDELPKSRVWQLARELVITIHEMTLTKLPKFELFEEGSQIRRAIKSVKSNIVEGYGRRRYKQEFIRFVDYALASCDETADHFDTLIAIKDAPTIDAITNGLEKLGRKLNLFLQGIERAHISEK